MGVRIEFLLMTRQESRNNAASELEVPRYQSTDERRREERAGEPVLCFVERAGSWFQCSPGDGQTSLTGLSVAVASFFKQFLFFIFTAAADPWKTTTASASHDANDQQTATARRGGGDDLSCVVSSGIWP